MALFSDEKIVDAKVFSVKKCKATIQRSGRLGFSAAAASLMKLTSTSCLLVSECGDGNLAVVVWPDNTDHRGFALHKATDYYTADLKGFFDQKSINYQQSGVTYIYDIVPTTERYLDNPVFKLTQRIKKRRTKSDGSECVAEE